MLKKTVSLYLDYVENARNTKNRMIFADVKVMESDRTLLDSIKHVLSVNHKDKE